MQHDLIVFAIFLIFTGAAVLGGLALYARQSLLVAYIVLGVLLGPWGFGLVVESSLIREIGNIGIMFLLFLLGLNLHPQKLLHTLREALLITLASSLVFAVLGTLIAGLSGFGTLESMLIGAMMMFSSTIIGLKLLPTTELHHHHMGEVIISVLLLQDIIAVVILMLLQNTGTDDMNWRVVSLLVLTLPGLVIAAFVFERLILVRLFRRFDSIHEYVFLTAIGWCLGIAHLAKVVGLTYEIGAFLAGVILASNPIATYIAESLKPLRDFFLVMFFFSLGAGFELPLLPQVALPAAALALVMLIAKPYVFRLLLVRIGEALQFSREIGVRLGQTSEFSLFIAVLAVQSGIISDRASYLIQTATLLTFIVSSYVIMLRFPTPIAVSERLRRD